MEVCNVYFLRLASFTRYYDCDIHLMLITAVPVIGSFWLLYTIQFYLTQSNVDRHIVYFQYGTTMNNATMYTILHVPWCILISYIPSEVIAEWKGWYMLGFHRFCKIVSPSSYTNLYFYLQCIKDVDFFSLTQGFIIISHCGFSLHFSNKLTGIFNISLKKDNIFC